jgi:hypothetical protein
MIEILYWIHENLFPFGNGNLVGYIENSGVGLVGTLCLFLIPFLFTFIYYIGIDHPKLSNKLIWLITFLLVSVITAIVLDGVIYKYVLTYLEQELPEELIDNFTEELLNIGIVNFIIALLISILFSFLLKLKSKNCSKTPF